MSEQDEQYIIWLCEQALKWKDTELVSQYLSWIKEHASHLRRLAEAGTTASHQDTSEQY